MWACDIMLTCQRQTSKLAIQVCAQTSELHLNAWRHSTQKLMRSHVQNKHQCGNLIELYRVLLRSMELTHFWQITIHLQSVVGATICNWHQWNMSQATTILPALSLKSIDRVISFHKISQNILVFSIISWFDAFWDKSYSNQVSKYIFIYHWCLTTKCAESE